MNVNPQSPDQLAELPQTPLRLPSTLSKKDLALIVGIITLVGSGIGGIAGGGSHPAILIGGGAGFILGLIVAYGANCHSSMRKVKQLRHLLDENTKSFSSPYGLIENPDDLAAAKKKFPIDNASHNLRGQSG